MNQPIPSFWPVVIPIVMLLVLLAVGIHKGDPAQVIAWPIQCRKGCTLLHGDWPVMYRCSEYDFQESQ